MYTVVAQRIIAAPIEKVWDYLTKPPLLARWFADTQHFAAGDEFRFDFGDGDFFAGRVIDWKPRVSLSVEWKLVGIGPRYKVHFSVLPRKGGSEVSIQDRGALTLDEAECLRVGWSEFLMRFEKAVCHGRNARFKWRKTIDFTSLVFPDRLQRVMSTLGDPDWYRKTFEGGWAEIELSRPDRVVATYSTERWRPDVTQIRIKHECVSNRDYILVAHDGWRNLTHASAEEERRQYLGLWLKGMEAVAS
jgi:uncharacterized protein YndB with AHSA1/START domain